MPFTPGHKLATGRPKGAKGKKSDDIREKCESLGIDVIDTLAYFSSGNWKALGYKSETFLKPAGASGVIEEMYIPPSLRLKAVIELSQYLHPKLKAIEHSGSIDSNIEAKAQVIISLPDNGRSPKSN